MSKEEKMMILQMVADGKVTPEQGAELLKAVGEEKPEDLSRNIQKGIETAARKAGDVAQKIAEHAGDIADRASSEGENLGKVLGESGENLGRILGESGENIGKIIARIFSGGGFEGPRFEFHEELTGDFPQDGEIQVNLATTNGRITVDTWDGPGYRLDVRKTVSGANEAEAKEFANDGYEYTHDGLNLTARAKHTTEGVNLFRQVNIGFTLTLPAGRPASLRLNSSNGRLAVSGVSGSYLGASTSNGRVEVEGCRFRNTEISSANGRIEFEGTPGDLNASTANGRICAKLGGSGEWKLNSANGRIEVEVRKSPDTAYSVEASTVAGKVSVEGMENAEVLLDESRQKYGSRRFHARTRGYSDAANKASLRASTTMGRVTVTF